MARVFIPTMLQPLAGGVKEVTLEARTVRQVVNGLEEMFPGIGERLVEGGSLRPNLVVAVDGQTSRLGMLEKVGEESEVHFIPAIGGG
jgi:molybdopterin synthase sulfur carrier subunit